ncbi:hypothetical protein C8J56DRAFT_382566 [Mycena floridula]|nr:hypothetical protein C8J56DRAFT_382566 [Mycena floridula]
MSDEEKNPVEGLPTPPAELVYETSAPEPEPEPEPEKPTTRTFALHESFDARCIHPTGNEPARPFSFSDDFMTDLHTGVSYAFFNATRNPAHDTDYLQTQAITLYSNQSESHSMADRLVAAAGEKYGTDILILDALQLALGRHGILGEGGIVLEAIFDSTKRKSDDVPKGVDQEESALFWESLLVRSAGEHKRRIVYLRDIGSIAKAAKPALAHIFRASHNLRLKRSKDPASQIPDLVFVFGVCKESGVNAPMVKHLGLKEESASHGFVSYSMARKRLKSDKVAQQIPTLSDQLLSCARHPSSKGLAAQFFLSRLVPTKAMDTNTLYHDIEGTWEPYALETWQRSTCFHVEALDSQSSAFRLAIQDCIDIRTSLISQSLLQFSLMQRGVTVEGSRLTLPLLDRGLRRISFTIAFLRHMSQRRLRQLRLDMLIRDPWGMGLRFRSRMH